MSDPTETDRGDWTSAKPEVLAQPTWWPAAVGFGITLVAWGLITSQIVFAVGVAVLAVAIAGWIGDIRHERKD